MNELKNLTDEELQQDLTIAYTARERYRYESQSWRRWNYRMHEIYAEMARRDAEARAQQEASNE